MFLTIGEVLSETELAQLPELIKTLRWQDGATTAGHRAKSVKRNEQADLSSAAGQGIVKSVRGALDRQPVFQAAARPRTISNLLLSRISKDGGYGPHVDNALMGRGVNQLRSDMSFTLFLNEPDEYEGGALNIDSPAGTQSIKLAAGDMVLYSSSLIHEVGTVTAGQRLVLVGWVESHIRDPFQRELMFDLDRVRVGLNANSAVSEEGRLMLDKVYSNLLRMWAGR